MTSQLIYGGHLITSGISKVIFYLPEDFEDKYCQLFLTIQGITFFLKEWFYSDYFYQRNILQDYNKDIEML